MQCTRKPRGHVFMCPLSLLWHKVGLLVPWYITQELISINQVICEPSQRHCRQGRKIVTRIYINSSKKASASPPGWQGLLQSACCRAADWSQEMIPCWGLRVDLSCWQVTCPSAAEALQRESSSWLTFVHPPFLPTWLLHPGALAEALEWWRQRLADVNGWAILCIWCSVFIYGICSLVGIDVKHKDSHALCPEPLVHPKASCSNVLVFALTVLQYLTIL